MPADFSHQDLHDRRFRNQDLRGANFSHADIRGCDFSRANLTGANFQNAKPGYTGRQLLVPVLAAIAILGGLGYALAKLIYGVLGQAPSDRAWNYVIVLAVVLLLTGITTGIRVRTRENSRLGKLAGVATGSLCGAIAGFFYAGILTNSNPQMAIAGSVSLGLLMIPLGFFVKARGLTIGVPLAGAIATYGATFLIGVRAMALLSVGQFGWGTLLALVALLYFRITWLALVRTGQTGRRAIGTSFYQANLTQTNFTGVDRSRADFTNTFAEDDPMSSSDPSEPTHS